MANPATGGSGSGDGFGSQPQQVIVKSGTAICIYVSDGNGQASAPNDIAAFEKSTKVGNFSDPQANGDAFGLGLAAIPNGKVLYASYTDDSELGIWTINADCSLTLDDTIAAHGTVDGMRVSPDGKTLVVSLPVGPGEVDSYAISGTTLTEKGPYPTTNDSGGVDITADSKYALVTEAGVVNTAEVEIFPINSDSSLGTGTDITLQNAGDEPGSIWLSPDGKFAYMGVTSSDTPEGITVTALNFDESTLSLTLNCLVTLNNPDDELEFAGQVATITPSGHGGGLYVTEVGSPSAMALLQIQSSGCPFEVPGSPFTNTVGEWPFSVSAFPPRPF